MKVRMEKKTRVGSPCRRRAKATTPAATPSPSRIKPMAAGRTSWRRASRTEGDTGEVYLIPWDRLPPSTARQGPEDGMIQLLQAKNFRMLLSNSVALQPYQVLVGQNATGKSTFLGSFQFLRDVAKYGVRH